MYGNEYIWNKEDLWIDFIENANIKSHWGFIFWNSCQKVRLWNYLKQRSAVDLFDWKCWYKVPLGIYFVETRDMKYGCEFIYKKEELLIDLIENAEIMYQWGFILLKLSIKSKAVNLFKRKKTCGLISLKMLI